VTLAQLRARLYREACLLRPIRDWHTVLLYTMEHQRFLNGIDVPHFRNRIQQEGLGLLLQTIKRFWSVGQD